MEKPSEQEIFIIDSYDLLNKLGNQDVILTFQVNENTFCVRRTTLNWGRPNLLNRPIDENEEFLNFKIYNSLDEAKDFIKQLKQAESMKD